MEFAPSLIELLTVSAPADLQNLMIEYPDASDLFKTERMLGPEDGAPMVRPNRKAMIALISKSIKTIALDADKIATSIRNTIRRVSQIRFSGAIIATIAGGLAGILALGFPSEIVQATTAFAAMLGGVATVTADQFELAPSGVRIASTDEYAKLVEMRAALELVRLRIQQDRIIPLSDEDLTAMLGKLNDYSMNVLRLKLA